VATSERRKSPGVSPTGRHVDHEQRASITPRGAVHLLVLVVLSLTALSLIGQAAKHFLPDFVLRDRFAATFNLDEEGNVPTLYSTLAILSCAVLLRVIARIEREEGGRFSRDWTLMSIIFLGLAVDEFLFLHEEINYRLDLSGFTQWSWVAVGIVFVLVFAFLFFRMVVQLPSPVRRLFILAGLIYLSGAIVIETVGGHYVTVWGHDSIRYVLCTTAEEFLEMIGIVVFIYALLKYMTKGGREVVLALEVRADQDRVAK
jgi:multidrug transporter EmrE-like cation transporter